MEVSKPESTSQFCNTKQSWNACSSSSCSCPRDILLQGHVWYPPNQPETPLREVDTLNFEAWLCLSVNMDFSSVQSSCSVVSDSLRPHGLQHARPPCPSPTPGVYSNSYPLSQWCHPTKSSSVIPFSSHLESFPASGFFLMNQLFTSGSYSIGVSALASVLPMNIQDWFPLGWTGRISLQSKGLSIAFFNIIIQKHQFFGAQLSL